MVRRRTVDREKSLEKKKKREVRGRIDRVFPILFEGLFREILVELFEVTKLELRRRRYMIYLVEHIQNTLANVMIKDVSTSFVLPPHQRNIILNAFRLIQENIIQKNYIEKVVLRKKILPSDLVSFIRGDFLSTLSITLTRRVFMSEDILIKIKEGVMFFAIEEFWNVLTQPQLMNPLAERFILGLMIEDYAKALYYNEDT